MADVLAFDEMDFVPGGHPLERKKGPVGPVVLLEFREGFADPNWCERSHVLYVVEGRLDVELEGGVRRIEQGQAIFVRRGDAHRAANPGPGRSVVLAVSDL